MKTEHVNILAFDVESYLQDRGIEFVTEGKNTSNGWVETRCVFCDDNSAHLGISPERTISCWRCGVKGNVIKYIHEVENCSWDKAKKIVNEFVDETLSHLQYEDQQTFHGNKLILPQGLENLNERHYEYLQSRGFDPLLIEKKYKLKALGKSQNAEDRKFAYRIFVPILLNNRIVHFTMADYTGRRNPKYLHQEDEKAVYQMKECLYNIDTLRDIALIVEGVSDVWRMGDGAIATMGIKYTTAQINLLVRRKPKKIFIMFDAEEEAQSQANKLANSLAGFVNTEVLELDYNDPGSLTDSEAKHILREIGLR